MQGGPDLVQQEVHAGAGDRVDVAVGGLGDAPRQLHHVVALVAALGDRLAPCASSDRLAQKTGLGAVVVDVVLALHRVSGELEQPAKRVAVGGVAARRRGRRPGRIGRDELEEDPLCDLRAAGAVGVASLKDTAERRPEPVVGQKQVQEAGAGDLDPLEHAVEVGAQLVPQPLCDLARRLAEHGREQHGGIGRVVAELDLGGALERGRDPGRRPLPAEPSVTSISSIRYSGARSTAPDTLGCRARRAISVPEALYGEITRSAPARSSFFSASSALARAMTLMPGASSRALSVITMFSASESTQATIPRARSIPAARSSSSSEADPSRNRTPTACARSRLSGLSSTTTYLAPAAARSRATWRPTRP